MKTEQSPICLQPKEFKDYGVIVDGGSKVYMKGFTHYEVDKITDSSLKILQMTMMKSKLHQVHTKFSQKTKVCMIFHIHRNNKYDDACKIKYNE